MGNLFYLNSNFDLELGNISVERYRKFASEMTSVFLPIASAEDSVVLKIEPQQSYYDYLKQSGIDCAVPALAEKSYGAAVVWGMNTEARKVLENYGCDCDFPPCDIVKKINSREFSNSVCITNGYPHGEIVRSYDELADAVQRAEYPFVLKTEFGSSASGFIHLRSRDDLCRIEKAKNYFACGISLVLEKWRHRISDISAGFILGRNGSVSDFNVRKLICTGRGSFDALICGAEIKKDIYDKMEETAYVIAAASSAEGYFGPVSFDAYSFEENGRICFNPLSEINARMTMADVARLASVKTGGRISALKFIRGSHLDNYEDESELAAYFGEDSFRPDSTCGILMLTPLRYLSDGLIRRTERVLFCALAGTEKRAEDMIKKISKLEWNGSKNRQFRKK